MVRTSIAARKRKTTPPQVSEAAVPLQAPSGEVVEPVPAPTEPAQSVTETDIVDSTEPASEPQAEPEPASDDSYEQPIAAEAPEEAPECAEPSLDDDPETSLVGSIYLHLLSEHGLYEALSLSDDGAIAQHAYLHDQNECDHEVDDWRFRPLKALAASMRSTEESLALAEEMTAAVRANAVESAQPRP